MSRLVVMLLGLLVAVPAAAQPQVGTALPYAQQPPEAIEAPPPVAPPMAVRGQGAEPPPPPPPVAPPEPPKPGSMTVEVDSDAPSPENDTRRFIFRDVTDRTAPPVKTLAERKAAVEALRRSLGGAPR